MPAGPAPDLGALEARLRALLGPYEQDLEWATIYGLPTLRRPGAKAHDWFAFVKPASRHVSLLLLPVTRPQVAAVVPPLLAPRLTGKATFTFRAVSEEEAAAMAALLAAAYAVYMAGEPAG